MSNLSALRNNQSYKEIRITEDLTKTLTMTYKELAEVAKTKNQGDVDKICPRKFKKWNSLEEVPKDEKPEKLRI